MSLAKLTKALVEFRDARDWKQFHTLKNLIISLNLEAAELLELTQWKSEAEVEKIPNSAESLEALSDECADVFLYLLQIAETAGIDLEAAAYKKMEKNARKYPVEKSYSNRSKYTKL